MSHQRLWLALLVLALLRSELTESHYFKVGGDQGWTYGVNNWPNGIVFRPKYVLEFNYTVGIHNVVRVDKYGYENCVPNMNSAVYTSGADQIELNEGGNYFICTMPGHCVAGMRIAIEAN